MKWKNPLWNTVIQMAHILLLTSRRNEGWPFLPPWNASLHWVLFSCPPSIRIAHASEVNAFYSFVFHADLSQMQSPLTAVDSWISLGRPQQCQVNCLLRPQATVTVSHTLLNTLWAEARPSATVSFPVAVSIIIFVPIKQSVFIPPAVGF